MTQPLSLETILSEFPELTEVWVIGDKKTQKYLTVPDPRYPKKNIFRFFLSRTDAERFLTEVLDESEHLRDKDIYPLKVNLHNAVRGVSAEKNGGFVIHSPNEVYEWLKER